MILSHSWSIMTGFSFSISRKEDMDIDMESIKRHLEMLRVYIGGLMKKGKIINACYNCIAVITIIYL